MSDSLYHIIINIEKRTINLTKNRKWLPESKVKVTKYNLI